MPSSFDISQKCPIWLRALVPIKIWHNFQTLLTLPNETILYKCFLIDTIVIVIQQCCLFIKRASSKLANQSTVCLIKWFKAKNEVYFKSSYFEEYLVIVRSLILDRFIDDILKSPKAITDFKLNTVE